MNEEDLIDDRFRTLLADPKYKDPRRNDRKIKIDKRFQSMFKSDSFKVKYSVDKRGRPESKSTSEDLKKFYDISSDEDRKAPTSEESSDELSSESEEASEIDQKANDFPKLFKDEKKKAITSDIRDKLKDMKVDYARGEGRLFSESSSDESESEESEDEDLYHEWNELDKDAAVTNQVSNRLAICNMDWDRIRAVDLMMLLNSFLPTGAVVNSVVIYPSDYGLKRMREEETRGPAELLVDTNDGDSEYDSDENAEEGDRFHMERMRKYQLNRLKYYYAIATFDSPETADYVYTNCNGVEYESSGVRLDLRFVDDDTTFDQEPKDICKSTDNYENYQPRFFTNTALQQAKVELTWDETDPKRVEFTQKINEAAKNGEINDSDLEDYVALSSSGEDNDDDDDDDESNGEERTFEAIMSSGSSENESENSDNEDPISSYRKLLKEIEDNEKGDSESEELEITWGSGDAKKTSVSKSKKSSGSKDDLTPFERLIEKKKEKSKLKKSKSSKQNSDEASDESENLAKKKEVKRKKKKRSKHEMPEIDEKQKQELELLLLDENNEDNKHHFSLKKIQKNESKKKKKFKKKDKSNNSKTDDFQVDVNDDRFSAVYSSHLFNIDPTNPKFHKTKGMEAFITEKQKRIAQNSNKIEDLSNEPAVKIPRTTCDEKLSRELSSLVKSIKNKSKHMLPNKFGKK
ncbi:ESF1 homolog [Planococcus citri]|uniref:ESF1 homolog n=1 Tax=Planococcus citri TaxID=170843 RepID=UPI0031F9166C